MILPRVMSRDRLAASAVNLTADAIQAAQVRTGSRTTRGTFPRRGRTLWSGSSGDEIWESVAFGFSISGAVVTILAGDVYRGTRAVYEVAETEVTITADHQYVPLYVYLTQTEAWAEVFTPSIVKPQPSASIWAIWLHKFRLQGGVATHECAGVVGNVYLPGVAA